VWARSEEDADDELLSVALVKGGNKVVTGSQEGVLNLYSWGYFNDCSDRFPGVNLRCCIDDCRRTFQ
jgi:ATP-dependent RNA helicase DOB1